MKTSSSFLILAVIALTGCGGARKKARDVAVTTFRVIDAPARYVRDRIDPPQGTTTTTTTTTEVPSSDVVTPGRPVAARPQQQPTTTVRTPAATGSAPAATPRATPRPQTAAATPRPSPPATATTATEFPVAKPVPDKPGFVLSPYDGAFVDVTGFKSGDKARDPKTKQIFIVP